MARPNLVPDPGFEQGISLGGWGGPGTSVAWERTLVHTGTGSLRASNTSATSSLIVRSAALSNTARGTGMYYGSMWVYADTDSAAHTGRVVLLCRNQAGTATVLSGPVVTLASRTWTELTHNASVPADTVTINLQFSSGDSGWAPTEFLIVDDTTLGPQLYTALTSKAAELGYGNWQFFGLTEPAAANTAASITPYTGADAVAGTTTAGGTASWTLLVNQAAEGEHTAQITVTGIGTAPAVWTMNDLDPIVTHLEPGLVNISVRWAVKDGHTEGDARIDWGDPAGEWNYASMQTAGYAEGLVDFGAHQYPVDPGSPGSFQVVITSGARAIVLTVEVPASSRAVVSTADGTQVAVIDIQEWPTHDMQRGAALLPIVGRAEPVVLLDTLRLPSSTITFLTRDATEANALLDVLQYRGKIRLISPCPGVESIWFVVMSTSRVRLTNTGTEVRRLWPTNIQEVTAP